MSETLLIAILNLTAKIGIDGTIAVIQGIKNAKTIDDAIAALEKAKTKTAADYKAEAP